MRCGKPRNCGIAPGRASEGDFAVAPPEGGETWLGGLSGWGRPARLCALRAPFSRNSSIVGNPNADGATFRPLAPGLLDGSIGGVGKRGRSRSGSTRETRPQDLRRGVPTTLDTTRDRNFLFWSVNGRLRGGFYAGKTRPYPGFSQTLLSPARTKEKPGWSCIELLARRDRHTRLLLLPPSFGPNVRRSLAGLRFFYPPPSSTPAHS